MDSCCASKPASSCIKAVVRRPEISILVFFNSLSLVSSLVCYSSRRDQIPCCLNCASGISSRDQVQVIALCHTHTRSRDYKSRVAVSHTNLGLSQANVYSACYTVPTLAVSPFFWTTLMSNCIPPSCICQPPSPPLTPSHADPTSLCDLQVTSP